MIIKSPGVEVPLVAGDSDLTMIGFVREKYYRWLQDKGLLPKSSEDTGCIGNEFYFYYHAIKNGKVYTLHKDTNKAKNLRLTLTDYYSAKIIEGKKFEDLEPLRAKIISSELVSRLRLQEILSDYPENDDFQADFYYLVKAKIDNIYDDGIVAISTEENDIISPYSPKIVKIS